MARIPALTLSGGNLSTFGGQGAAREFRVWVHPFRGGDDHCYRFKTYARAARGRVRIAARGEGRVEKVVAVVLDGELIGNVTTQYW